VKVDDILPVRPRTDFCFSIDAGFAEAEQGARIEEVLSVAEARETVFYEYTTC
jgi:hypothetical protein